MAIDFKKFIKGIVLGNDVDPSKKLQVEVTSSATTTTKTTVQASQTADRTIILPDASDTLVGKATTDTLTNKTFDADGTGNSITNIENADIKSGAAIDAAKLADGSVSNAEFQYLANVTSDIQTQFNDTNTAITDHVNDATDAHDASAISNTPTGNLAATDVQNALNELQTDVDTRLLKAGDTMSGNLNMGSNLITSLATPVSGTDATNKNYVDGIAAGLDPKESVRVASAASVGGSYATTPSNGQFTGAATTVDGVALSVSDRVLIKDQVDQKQNGIYVYTAAGEFTRSADMDGSPASEVSGGNFVFVAEGATNGASGYVLIANGLVTLNTDNLVFTQFSGGANSANKALSNLDSPTAINQDLLPDVDNTIDLGSASKRYTTAYIQEMRDASNNQVQSITGRILYDSSGSTSIDHSSTSVIAVNSKRISSLGDAVDVNDAVSKTDLVNALKNYITLGDAVSTVVGASVDTYGSGTTRPAGSLTGVSTGVTFTRSTSSPLTGTGSFILDKDAANRQGRVAYYGFTLQNADKAKVMQIEMDYIVNSGTFVAGSSSTDSDVIMYIHDVTNNVFIEPSSFKLLSNSTTIADKFVANFQTSATGTSYRLLFYISSTSSAAYSLKVDNIVVKPCTYVFGTPITDWQSFTPTGSWVNTTYTGKWRRVGDSIQSVVNLLLTASPNAADLTVNYIPSGLSVDTTKIPFGGGFAQLGYGTLLDSGTRIYEINPAYNGGNSAFIVHTEAGNTGLVNQANPITFTTNDQVNIFFEVPISGWSSSVQMSDSYSSREIGIIVSGPSSAVTGSATDITTWGTVTEDFTSSFNATTGVFTAPSQGTYKFSGSFLIAATLSSADKFAGVDLLVNGSTVRNTQTRATINNTNIGLPFSFEYPLNAGDAVKLQVICNGTSTSFNGGAAYNYYQISKNQAPTTISATEKVVFMAEGASSAAAGSNVTIPFNTPTEDSHGGWNSTNKDYTVPVSGTYKITCASRVSFSGATVNQYMDVIIQVDTVTKREFVKYLENTGVAALSGMVSYQVPLVAGQKIRGVLDTNLASPIMTTGTTHTYLEILRVK